HRDGVVDDERFVVHAMVDAREVGDDVERGERIEEADVDVGIGIERGEIDTRAGTVEVVDEKANTHAAVGGVKQRAQQIAAGGIVRPEKVLRVDGPLSEMRKGIARLESSAARRDEVEAGKIGMRAC